MTVTEWQEWSRESVGMCWWRVSFQGVKGSLSPMAGGALSWHQVSELGRETAVTDGNCWD